MRKPIPPEKRAEIGRAGGLATLKKRGKRFFSRISKRRKKFAGGRPPKEN